MSVQSRKRSGTTAKGRGKKRKEARKREKIEEAREERKSSSGPAPPLRLCCCLLLAAMPGGRKKYPSVWDHFHYLKEDIVLDKEVKVVAKPNGQHHRAWCRFAYHKKLAELKLTRSRKDVFGIAAQQHELALKVEGAASSSEAKKHKRRLNLFPLPGSPRSVRVLDRRRQDVEEPYRRLHRQAR